jgi:hypothetical protein
VLAAADSPFIVLATLTLMNSSCVIEPGVELNFTSATGIQLLGPTADLQIGGSSASPVVFQGWNGTSWAGVVEAGQPNVTLTVDWLVMSESIDGIWLEDPGPTNDITITNASIDGAGVAARGIRIFDPSSGTTTNVLIENCVITNVVGTGLFVGTDDQAEVRGCSATGCNQGVSLWNNVHGQSITVTGNGGGISLVPAPAGLVQLVSSVVSDNSGDGITISGAAGSVAPQVSATLISGNGRWGVDAIYPAVFRNCTVYGNAAFDVHVQAAVVANTTVDMQQCAWGLATTQEMEAEGTFSDISVFYDWWDDNTRSLVDYKNWLAPVSVDDRTSSWGAIKARYR